MTTATTAIVNPVAIAAKRLWVNRHVSHPTGKPTNMAMPTPAAVIS